MSNNFKEETVTTFNVKESLKKYALTHRIAVEKLTFDILGYANYYKTAPTAKWIKIENQQKAKIIQPKNLANPTLLLTEQIKIKIYPKTVQTSCIPVLTIKANSTKTVLHLYVSKRSKVPFTKACLNIFTKEIQRKLTLNGFYLGLFTFALEKVLQPLLKDVQQHKKMSKDFTLPLAKALPPKMGGAGERVLHYETKKTEKSNAMEEGVEVDELLLDYILPTFGTQGRSCLGKIVHADTKTTPQCELILFDPKTIKRTIENNTLKFYALKDGFVEFEHGKLSISSTIKLNVASLKETGHIIPGQDKEIDVKITNTDTTYDSVTQGVDIAVNTLDIDGSVAGNTTIVAQTVNIGEQTHKNSVLEVEEDATVNLHRGNMKAKNAEVDKFEHGTIEAQTVKVNTLLGGEILAKDVTIQELHSNATIYASDSIHIETIKGEHNSLVIAPKRIEDYKDRVAEQHEKKAVAKEQWSKQNEILQTKMKHYEVNYTRIAEFQKKAAIAIRAGENVPTATAVKLKQYEIDKIGISDYENIVSELQQELDTISDTLVHLENLYKYATISYAQEWDGKQEIVFEHTNDTKIERYVPVGYLKDICYENIDEDDLQLVKE